MMKNLVSCKLIWFQFNEAMHILYFDFGQIWQFTKKTLQFIWQIFKWVKMAWTFLLKSAQFFRFKNWFKITSRKKISLTSALVLASRGVKLTYLSKKCIFRAEKGIFSKSSFYSKMFSDPKYNFSVHQK